MVVMGVSAIVNFLVSRHPMKFGKQEDSIALIADGMHLRTDVSTSLGVFSGLILINITGWTVIDPIVAILVACLIMKAAYDLTRESS